MTARLIRACENPYVNVIGHPTGRNVETFAGYEFDYDAVFAAAARTGTALEIDGQPSRLDLPSAARAAGARVRRDLHLRLRRARRRRARTTSPTPSDRRAARGSTPADVLNARPLEEVLAFVEAKRPRPTRCRFAPIRPTRSRRLAALDDYELLDTPDEELFDAFTRLAAQLCGTPISLISLIDARPPVVQVGRRPGPSTQTPRDVSFCAHAILERRRLRGRATDAPTPRFARQPAGHRRAAHPLLRRRAAALERRPRARHALRDRPPAARAHARAARRAARDRRHGGRAVRGAPRAAAAVRLLAHRAVPRRPGRARGSSSPATPRAATSATRMDELRSLPLARCCRARAAKAGWRTARRAARAPRQPAHACARSARRKDGTTLPDRAAHRADADQAPRDRARGRDRPDRERGGAAEHQPALGGDRGGAGPDHHRQARRDAGRAGHDRLRQRAFVRQKGARRPRT